jgi:hypothetical protein
MRPCGGRFANNRCVTLSSASGQAGSSATHPVRPAAREVLAVEHNLERAQCHAFERDRSRRDGELLDLRSTRTRANSS